MNAILGPLDIGPASQNRNTALCDKKRQFCSRRYRGRPSLDLLARRIRSGAWMATHSSRVDVPFIWGGIDGAAV